MKYPVIRKKTGTWKVKTTLLIESSCICPNMMQIMAMPLAMSTLLSLDWEMLFIRR